MNVNTNPQMNGGMIMNGTMGNMGQMANNQQMQPNHMQQNQQRQVRSRHTFSLVIAYIQQRLDIKSQNWIFTFHTFEQYFPGLGISL